MEFYVYETRQLVKARHRPLVVITSNNEKELPDAFLRRCFFHYIRFPDAETMTRIVRSTSPTSRLSCWPPRSKAFTTCAPCPASEEAQHLGLVDWIRLLLAEDVAAATIATEDGKVSVHLPPLVGALLQNERDLSLFEKLVFMQRPAADAGRATRDAGG